MLIPVVGMTSRLRRRVELDFPEPGSACGRGDPDDDTIRRYVVRHYRYDPDRHERRHVIVAAFDNKFEWDACMDATEAALRAGWDTSEAVDPREHVSGTVYEPGYRRLQQNGRLLRRAAEHGVWPLNWQDLELPANVGIVQVGLPKKRTPWWRRLFRGTRLSG